MILILAIKNQFCANDVITVSLNLRNEVHLYKDVFGGMYSSVRRFHSSLLLEREDCNMDYTLIIKLTNNCNLNCSYCYHRQDKSRNMQLSLTLEQIDLMIRQLMRHNERRAQFIWHGGEPLLAGIDTFRFIADKQKEYNTKNLIVSNSVQTNGTLLDEEYIEFFKKNNFSIGISIDGPYRYHAEKRGTTQAEYDTILNSIDSINRAGARLGTLCVIGKHHLGHAKEIIDLLTDHQIAHIGFLPCLVIGEDQEIDTSTTLSPEEYGCFMMELFDAWCSSGNECLSIRNFDDCIRFFRGKRARNCTSCHECGDYLTVTPDGGIYLCDNFSATENHRVGCLEEGFSGIEDTLPMKWLKAALNNIPSGCEKCRYFKACFGGCIYQRWIADPSMSGKQYYCGAFQKMYDYIGQKIQESVK